MFSRDISERIQDLATWFPVVSVTGPRQSGKSTLVRHVFSDYDYVNLENPDVYRQVNQSPMDFIRERPGRLIIDEAQRVPDIFSAIQVVSDERGEVGQYVLSGSQNFLMLKQITQSLAGRVGVARLLPLSYREQVNAGLGESVDDFMFRGGYPRLYNSRVPTQQFFDAYVSTYLERDVAEYVSAHNIATFRKFLFLCAHNAGQLLNVSRLSKDVGVSRATIDSWLSILAASYIIFLLPPYHASMRKRLTKTPKLYFYDTGLLCYLLGLFSSEDVRDSSMRGAIFENMVIEETMKRYMNNTETPQLFFYRDDSRREIDLVDKTGKNIELVEIKSRQGYAKGLDVHLNVVGEEFDIPIKQRRVVLRGAESFTVKGVRYVAAHEWFMRTSTRR